MMIRDALYWMLMGVSVFAMIAAAYTFFGAPNLFAECAPTSRLFFMYSIISAYSVCTALMIRYEHY